MARTITNQARLNYLVNDRPGTVLSNIATATLNEPLTADKNSVESTYRQGDELTFAVSFVNSGQTTLNDVTVTDDLGTYTLGGVEITPLTFAAPALYYVNGMLAGNITPDVSADNIEFTIPAVAPGANVLIIYKAQVNDGAQFTAGSRITNTVTVAADGLNTPVTASSTVTAEAYADVRITKSMTPANVTDGSPITYEFDIFNYGNTEATDIVLTDQFDPAPAGITVQLNGDIVDPDDYTYVDGLLTLPSGTGLALSLPAAVSTQDPVTGEVTVTPSSLSITVTGIL